MHMTAEQHLAELARLCEAMAAAGRPLPEYHGHALPCPDGHCTIPVCGYCAALYGYTRQHVSFDGACPNGHRTPVIARRNEMPYSGDDAELDRLLSDVYACTRVWEAWSYGTMSEDDFEPAAQTEVKAELIAWRDAAVSYRTLPCPFRIRVSDHALATVDRPANELDPAAGKVADSLGNWWHLAPPAPAASCGNCDAGLTWDHGTSAWVRADEPERGRGICRYPDGAWKAHAAVVSKVEGK